MNTPRTVLKIDTRNPGTELAAETSAALAAASITFRSSDHTYSHSLLNKAKMVSSLAPSLSIILFSKVVLYIFKIICCFDNINNCFDNSVIHIEKLHVQLILYVLPDCRLTKYHLMLESRVRN